MKTSVELSESKIELARSLSGAKTIKDILDQALDALIAQNRRKDLAHLLGTDFFDGSLDILRERKKDAR